MEIISVNPSKPDLNLVQKAADIILNNGVIGYPTETVYGLGANALNDVAVEKVFQLKRRERNKPILIISSDIEQVKKLIFSFPVTAEILAKHFWPGPITMVFKATSNLPERLLGGSLRIGIRIPDNKICLELLRRCGVPITSTSANISGQKNPISAQEVSKNFGDKLDLIIDGGRSPSRVPSTVVAVDNDRITLIREGAIPKQQIEQAIGNLTNEKKQ
ncbi:MAG: threonylcarbamoyl-AMP synthase [bacterium]|nr:MAG: threonylcarbamoyl-AMP synthase [bacterium]